MRNKRKDRAMRSIGTVLAGVWLVCCGAANGTRVSAAEDQPGDANAAVPASEVDFARDVRPILSQRCFACHGSRRQESGLRLNQRESALGGGDSGEKAIVPGEPDQSRLIRLVRGDDPDQIMPPKDEGQPLTPQEIDILVRWVRAGANWPSDADAQESVQDHWAWQPPVDPPLPAVVRTDWPRQKLDYYVLARLERENLRPSPEADRYAIIRRLSLDLIGLPPTWEQVEAFVHDERPDAYEQLVDQLLADPAYGERWARVWLDLARYADSKGYGSDPLRTIWRYRDWVIDAFNRNETYDQFTIDQLAGDLLPNPTMDQLLATAFHRNTMANDEGGTDDEEFRVAAIKDRIETTMQVWMGLTVGCAKCHSHKFDPITQREYYQCYAFFNQTEDADRPDESPRIPTPTRELQSQMDQLRGEIAQLQQELASPPADLASAQASWEEAVRAQANQWTVLHPVQATSAGGATLQVQPDGSILASGDSPETDTYTIQTTTNLESIRAFRLEALVDDSLPGRGPGRQPEGGNFVLNELSVSVARQETSPTQGRYLRVENTGAQRILSLAEVQIFRADENLALTGKASQSSTDYEGLAALAIDDNTSGDFFGGKSVTHTATEDNPWWECDLGSALPVERVVIWNRTDGNVQGRLANFRLVLLDDARNPVWETTVAEPPNPSVSVSLSGPLSVALSHPWADYEQEGLGAAKALDGDPQPPSGWAIGGQLGRAHQLIVETAKPIGSAEGTTLRFSLAQTFGMRHTLGRFRISATIADLPLAIVSGRVAELIAIPSAERTPEQASELAIAYVAIAPSLQPKRDALAQKQAQLQALEQQAPTTPILRELAQDQQRTTRIMLKGNFLNPGDQVQPAVPSAFHALRSDLPPNRLALAQWLLAPENPLTARVTVNRFWAQLFGTGLVETEEDFGTQGTLPSHQDLLDHLAIEFVRGGWDVKAILKTIVTSATYRQSSSAPAELVHKDPHNRLLARGSRSRLEAEMVRDQALALSGLLSHKVGGPSVYPPQPDGLWRAAFNGERTWPTSTGEDRYRRGLYTYWRRTVPYPSMATFDAPSREICTLRRISTNTPLQALVTLNDPVYVECAQALGRRMVKEGGTTSAERAAFGLRICLSRPATADQIAQVVALYDSELAHFQQDAASAASLATDPLGPLEAGQDAAEMAAWTVVGNVLLNLDGVLTKR